MVPDLVGEAAASGYHPRFSYQLSYYCRSQAEKRYKVAPLHFWE
jgi:hypothetical protein